jgi:hypothetical protein
MAYVPADAKWFLADLIVELRIEGDPRNVVHINTLLIRADSAEEAYLKAWELGISQDRDDENSEGKTVAIKFRGLRDLFVIHDELDHGAELIYSEQIGLSEDEVGKLVRPKASLSVFEPPCPTPGPNYMPGSIRTMLVEVMGEDVMNDFMRQRGDRP